MFWWEGKIDQALLKKAAENIVLHSPVLQTRIKSILGSIFRFVKKDKNFNIDSIFSINDNPHGDPWGIHEIPDETTIHFINDYMNLSKTPPVRFHLSYRKNDNNEDESVFLLKLHHSAGDGLAGFILASKVFQEYNSLCNKDNKIDLPLHPPHYSMDSLKKQLKAPIPSAPAKKEGTISYVRDNDTTSGKTKTIVYTLLPNEFRAIKDMSKAAQYTINDLTMAIIAKTIYNMLIKRNRPIDIIRIEQPIGLREELKIKGGIANFFSLFSIDLSKEDFSDDVKLTQVVKAKIKEKMDAKEHIRLLFGGGFLKIIPSELLKLLVKYSAKQFLNGKSNLTTTLANLGRLDNMVESPFDHKITHAWSLTPAQFTYGMDWLANTINNNMAINLVYYNPAITDETALETLDELKKVIREFITIKPGDL